MTLNKILTVLYACTIQQQIIKPCNGKTYKQCFTFENNNWYYWYNTKDNSTHILIVKQYRLLHSLGVLCGNIINTIILSTIPSLKNAWYK